MNYIPLIFEDVIYEIDRIFLEEVSECSVLMLEIRTLYILVFLTNLRNKSKYSLATESLGAITIEIVPLFCNLRLIRYERSKIF